MRRWQCPFRVPPILQWAYEVLCSPCCSCRYKRPFHGRQLIRKLDTTGDVDEIKAFFGCMHASLLVHPCCISSRTYTSTSRAGGRAGCLGRLLPPTGGLPNPTASRCALPRGKRKAVVLATVLLLPYEERTVAVTA